MSGTAGGGTADLPDGLGEALTEALGTAVRSASPVRGGDLNRAWRLGTDDGPVFCKAHPTAGAEGFATEAAGLAWLAEPQALRLPAVLATGAVPGSDWSFLALEWIEPGTPAPDHDERLGRGLAQLHDAGAAVFGLDRPGALGSLRLDNDPLPTWPEFFAERRLLPLARRAVDAGALAPGGLDLAERVARRLPELAGPDEPPARLHGDLWAGNAMVDADGGPVLVDPAAHGGHREVDLAMMDLFGGFAARVTDAYAEVHPLADGWHQRLRLWQLQPLLVHAVLFGGDYGRSALAVLQAYA